MLIYRVTNTVNGKVYIGKTVTTLGRRWTYHKYQAKVGGGCPHFGAAIRKYGPQGFMVEPLHTADTAEDLSRLEIQEIATHHSNDPSQGYNLTAGGEGLVGFHHSEKTKAVMRRKHRGVNHPMFGRHHTAEARQAISEHTMGERNHFFGKKHSALSRLRMGHKGEQHPNFGKHLAEDVRDKIRNSNSRPYFFIAPDGSLVQGVNLKAFCAANGLSESKMCSLRTGRLLHYRGWVRGY